MDVAALLVACISLVVASLALGWQVASWHMDGPRVKVRLKQGLAGRASVVSAYVERSGHLRDMSPMVEQGWEGPHLIGIEVVNVGRTRQQVTGTSVSLRRGGMSVSFPAGNPWSPDLPHWIEPGTSETWYADLDDAITLAQTTRKVVDKRAGGVHMVVELGSGRKVRTRRYLNL